VLSALLDVGPDWYRFDGKAAKTITRRTAVAAASSRDVIGGEAKASRDQGPVYLGGVDTTHRPGR
jgi:hypothetical protein